MVLGHHVFINIIDHLNAYAPVSQAEIVVHLMYLRYDEINKCVLTVRYMSFATQTKYE